MCKFNKGIRLCSCESEKIIFRERENYEKINGEYVKIPNKKNETIPLIYIWRLFRVKYKKKGLELGRYMFPVDDIGNGLNADWILLNLNVENCFDFEYSPSEGDNLIIQRNEIMSPYISFIFKNGEWIIKHYSPFEWDVNHLKDGVIKPV